MSWICPKCSTENADFVLDGIKKTECLCGYKKYSEKSAEPEATKKCPYCAETILIDAKKCKHCGELLDSQLKKKETIKVVAKEGCFLQTLNVGCIAFIIIIALIIFIFYQA